MEAKNILVVDDLLDFRDLISLLLSYEKYNLYFGVDGPSGLKEFQNNKIDLVLTDYHMPIKNGLWLLKEIRTISTNIPVIMMTCDLLIKKEDLLLAGAKEVICKYHLSRRLIQAIQEHL